MASERLARMHTAEHILSAIMRREYGAPRNLELHLGEKKTKCDYTPSRRIDEADIAHIERRVNEEIQKGHTVQAYTLSRQEAAERYDLWKVPAHADTIRIVVIGDLDAQPCSGPHVQNTRDVGIFRILSYDLRDNGRIRIRFKVE